MSAHPGPESNAEPRVPPSRQAEFLATRASLLGRLKNVEDHASWQDFFNTYWRLIYGVARQAGLTDAEAQDAVQDTVIAVARNMPAFRYDPARCSFKSWLWLLTRQRIIWQIRLRARPGAASTLPPAPAEDGTPVAPLDQLPDPAGDGLEELWEREWRKNLFSAALERVKQQVDAAQFQIFDLYCVEGWPVRKVAQTLGVNVGRVYLAKHRISKLLKKELKWLEEKAPG